MNRSCGTWMKMPSASAHNRSPARIEGRKVFTSGSIRAGERLCAEAEGIFIQVPHERFIAHSLEHGGDAGSGDVS